MVVKESSVIFGKEELFLRACESPQATKILWPEIEKLGLADRFCPGCKGAGKCLNCGGSGMVHYRFAEYGSDTGTCSECRGKGRCHECDGGRLETYEMKVNRNVKAIGQVQKELEDLSANRRFAVVKHGKEMDNFDLLEKARLKDLESLRAESDRLTAEKAGSHNTSGT